MPPPKGSHNNPHGRPRAGMAYLEQLREAVAKVGKQYGKSLMLHAVQRAYKSDVVLIALLKKLVPDLTEGEYRIVGELAEKIRAARERLKIDQR